MPNTVRATEAEEATTNPARDVKLIKYKTKGTPC